MINLDRFLETPVQAIKKRTWAKDLYSCIPMDHPMVLRAREIIPPVWWVNTYVAGSAATRFGQHADVDVWVTEVPRSQDLWRILPENEKRDVDIGEDYEHIAIKVYNNPDEKLQIMATHDPINALLDGFDISVHCGAMNIVTGEQIRGKGYSEKVLIVNYIESQPVLTLTRYLTFAKRYRDFGGMFSEKVQKCAADTFYLKTPAQMEQELRDNYIDRGL